MRLVAGLVLIFCAACSPQKEPTSPEGRRSASGPAAAPDSPNASRREIPTCDAPFEQLLGDAVFADYAVPAEQRLEPVPPDVRTGKPHLYRTVIRKQASAGPDFAGHYTIIHIGCGAASTCLAIADAKTGAVHFPDQLAGVTDLLVLVPRGHDRFGRLNYRRDSRLLVVRGAADSDSERVGLSYFEWTNDDLRLVRFIPAGELCRLSEEEQYWLHERAG